MRNVKENKPKKRIIRTALLIILLLFAVTAIITKVYKSVRAKAPNADETATHEGFYVDGTVLRNSDGTPFVMRGVNHAHCWYRDEDETALDAIAATGANTVRIVLSCGIQWEADDENSLANIIEMVHSRGMVAVVEVHDGTGSDDIDTLKQIAQFWCDMADVLEGTEAYVILNIANEWCGGWSGKTWSEGYTTAIPKIREAGIKNTLMVDAAGWGQYATVIDRYGMKVFNCDPAHNTMFSVHMYGISGRFGWTIRYNLKTATAQNLCICVGEFGYTHSDGDVKEDYLMDYCDEQQIGYLAWSWKGNSGGVEYLDLAKEWDGSVLTPEWGEKVIERLGK